MNVKLAFIACVGRMADARNGLVVGGGFVSPYAQHDYNHLFKPLPASNLPEFRTNCRPSQQQLRTTLALSSSTSALPPKMVQRSTNRVARSRDIINIPYNSCTISIRLSVRWSQPHHPLIHVRPSSVIHPVDGGDDVLTPWHHMVHHRGCA